jgi:L-cysteine S-thiosulfotransferase
MKTDIRLYSALLTLTLLTGCDLGPKSGRGFVFPEGDLARGQKAFVDLKCVECHRVEGVTGLPPPAVAPEKIVLLGGEVATVRTYGALVTAVIHPAQARTTGAPGLGRKDAVMPSVNETMTVAQMLDIVTFLHPRYRKLVPLHEYHVVP